MIAALLIWPATAINVLWYGNPSMWCVAALAIATTGRSFAAPFVLLKPTLLPFAFWGVGRRSWWLGLAVLGVVSLALWPLWGEYIAAIGNARNADWLYQLWHLPAMLIPLIAYLGSGDQSQSLFRGVSTGR